MNVDVDEIYMNLFVIFMVIVGTMSFVLGALNFSRTLSWIKTTRSKLKTTRSKLKSIIAAQDEKIANIEKWIEEEKEFRRLARESSYSLDNMTRKSF